MSRTRRLIGGAGISYLHQAAIVLVGLWLTPFLLARIGQHSLGLWLVAGQILGYLALADLGVIAILPREVAFASGRTEPGTATRLIRGLVAQVRRIVRWQVMGLAVICLALWLLLPADWEALRWPLVIVFVTFVAVYPARVDIAVLQGLQDLPFLSKSQLYGWILSTAVTVGLVVWGWGLTALVLGWALALAVPAIAAIVRSRAKLSNGDAVPADSVRHYFQQSLWVSLSQIAQVLLNGSDVLLIGAMLGPAAVVPYACTGKLVTVFANHPSLLMHAAQPALSELRASESKQRLATVATALTQVMLMMSSALVIAILATNHFFVSWWIGGEQYGGPWLTMAFAGMMLFRHWNVATVFTLFCFGYEKQISLTSLADGALTVLLTWIFVSLWGPIGAPLGSICGVLCISLPFNLRSVAREMDMTVIAFVRTLAPLLWRVVALAAAAIAASLWLSSARFVDMVAVALPLGAAFAALVLPLAWHGPVGPYLRMALPRMPFGTPRTESAS